MNKWSVTIACGALILGTFLWCTYMVIGWHYFDMPYPHVIGSIFHLDGEAAEDAVYWEVWLEFIAVAVIAIIGARLLWRRISN